MNHSFGLLRLLGFLTLFLALTLSIPLLLALILGDDGFKPLLKATLTTTVLGILLFGIFRTPPHELTRREGILLVVASWLSVSFLGALPFYFSGYFPSFTDAFFESISGFTTTGASVLRDVEALPQSLLFWRSFTQWLGGMGIILLGIAVFPLIGLGGTQLYRAEFSGAHSEKLKPRIAETARALWKIYVAFTVAGFGALLWAGMGPFDAICHAFTTIATAGFSTRNESIGAFGSVHLELIIVFFMVLSGINFTRHYRFLVERQPGGFFGDLEIRVYGAILCVATLVVTVSILQSSALPLSESARKALFQVVSITTTTGFVSTDFEKWSSFAQLLLLALMFAGGCTGSTAGGLKTARLLLLTRVIGREFRRMVEPRGVFTIRFGNQTVSQDSIQSLLNLVYLSFLINFAGCLLLTSVGIDILTAISAVAAAMFNIGPGLGGVGPSENYSHLPVLAKWVLSICMLAGRLEFYTLLVLFTPGFWRK